MTPGFPAGRRTAVGRSRATAGPGDRAAGSGDPAAGSGRRAGGSGCTRTRPSDAPENRFRGDRGSGTVLVLTVAVLVVLTATVLAALASVAVARHRAAGVADLAALAAADRAHLGAEEACAVAERVATAAGASVVRCRVAGDVAQVTAQVRPAGRLGELGAATGRARAGPLEPGPGAR